MQPPAALPVLLLLVAAARPGAGLAPAAMSFEPEAADPLPTSSDSSSTSSSSAAAPFARPAADPPRAAAPPLPYRARPPSTAPPPPPPSPPDALLGALPNFAGQLCFSSRSACAAATVCGPLGVDCSTSLASLFTSCTSGPANLATNVSSVWSPAGGVDGVDQARRRQTLNLIAAISLTTQIAVGV